MIRARNVRAPTKNRRHSSGRSFGLNCIVRIANRIRHLVLCFIGLYGKHNHRHIFHQVDLSCSGVLAHKGPGCFPRLFPLPKPGNQDSPCARPPRPRTRPASASETVMQRHRLARTDSRHGQLYERHRKLKCGNGSITCVGIRDFSRRPSSVEAGEVCPRRSVFFD